MKNFILSYVMLLLVVFMVGCTINIGKLITVESENELENSTLTQKFGSLTSTDSSDIAAEQDISFKDLMDMIPADIISEAMQYTNAGAAVPETLLNAIDVLTAQQDANGGVITNPSGDTTQIDIDPSRPEISIDSVMHRVFRATECAPAYGKELIVTFESGISFAVPDSTKDVNSTQGYGYRPGCGMGAVSEKNEPHTAIYSVPGDVSTWVKLSKMDE